MQRLITGLMFFASLLQLQAQDSSLQEKLRSKQYEKIIGLIPELSAADSANAEITNTIAQAYEGMMDYRNAYNWYKMNMPETKSTEYLLSIGKVSMLLGRDGEAKGYFENAIAQDSTNFYARYQLGQIARVEENMDEAIDIFERLSFKYPSNVNLHTTLADCYLRQKDGGRAAYALLTAHKLNRENPDIAANLANLILKIDGKPSDAVIVCDSTLRYAPNNKKLLFAKAMALYSNKDYEEADSVFTTLLQRQDSSFANLKYAGASRLGIQRYHSADSVLSVAYETDPAEVENAILYAKALSGARQPDKSLSILAKCDSPLVPQKAFVYEILKTKGDCAVHQKQYETALSYYYDAYLLIPERKNILMNMSTLCRHLPRDKSIFILKEMTKVAKEQNQSLKPIGGMYWPLLQEYQKELFFANAKSTDIRSPKGKVSQIPFEEIDSLIGVFK